MDDEETVALIAGGHAFGKTHGAGDASQVGKEPEGADIHQAGLGWSNPQGKGNAEDTISSGLEVTWTPNPTQWDNDYLKMIYGYDKWELEESPAGAKQWRPVADEVHLAPHAHLDGQHVEIRMLTTDLALRFGDEEYDRISRKFLEDFEYFSDVFARAWFKLTHRDMGPLSRYHGAEVPEEVLLWQDPISGSASSINLSTDIDLTYELVNSGISDVDFIKTAWASASSFRNTDKRGGANGARIALEPQRSWEVNEPEVIDRVISKLKEINERFNVSDSVSLADMIVYAGNLAIRRATRDAGVSARIDSPLENHYGRRDATQEETDIESFEYLRPIADGFRNWAPGNEEIAERLLIEKAALLGLTPTELTVLVGGLRVLGVTHGDSTHGVLTDTPGVLDNSYFRNLLSNDIAWAPKAGQPGVYGSHAYKDGERKWTATRADLVFASNSVLRAIAEVYASDDAREKFVEDFVKAWTKVMNLDRFDI
jgi:catalase-peroxidase